MNLTRIQAAMATCTFGLVLQTCAAQAIPDVNAVFKVGSSKTIEVSLPKEAFIGAPASPSPLPRGYRGKPEREDDFIKRSIKISIFETMKLKGGLRVGLRLDEVDANGTIVPHMVHSRRGRTDGSEPDDKKRARANSPYVMGDQPLFYAYLYIADARSAMVASTWLMPKQENSVDAYMVGEMGVIGSVRGGLPFPLTLTSPPVTVGGERLKENSHLHGQYGRVFSASEDIMDNEVPRKKVHAILCRRVSSSDDGVKSEDILHYSEDQKSLIKDDGGIGVIIAARETQIWKKQFDWLWLAMERTDAEGNVLMRCKQVR